MNKRLNPRKRTLGESVCSVLSKTLKLCFVFFLLSCPMFVTSVSAQSTTVKISMNNPTIGDVVKELHRQTGYEFSYDADILAQRLSKKVSLDVKNERLDNVLSRIFDDSGVDFRIVNNRIFLKSNKKTTVSAGATKTQQQPATRLISGKVMDERGETLPGATLLIKENKRGGITDADGRFSLLISPDEKTIIVSFVGMQTREITIGNQNIFNITLQPTADLLEEVVVTGYQTISKERATGSFAVVSPNTLKDKLQTSILSRLEGQVAGMVQSGNSFTIRGISTLRGGTQPLLVVDGMPFEGSIESINPAIITNITILKDAAAASIYGAKAANGVIVISTKEGSRDGKTRVNYDGSIRFSPIPNYDYLNLMDSRELVDLQQSGFKFVTENKNPRYAVNPVVDLLFQHKKALITDAQLAEGLNKYRQMDNREQLKDFYLRTGIMHQHNLSLAGGNAANRYIASVNYMGNYGNAKYSNNERLGFTLRDNMQFFSWLSADLGVAASFTKSQGDSGMGSYLGFLTGSPSYYMLQDEAGNPLNILRSKSDMELARLRSIGLRDETYSPITNRQEETFLNKNSYYRVQLGLNFKLAEGLNLDVKYQTENSSGKSRNLYSKNSYLVRSMINNAAQYNSDKKTLTLNVPVGGQLSETRGDSYSYTFRTQLNFQKEIGKQYITALAGAERRLTRETATQAYYMGYDDNSLGFKPINNLMFPLSGTEAVGGSFNWENSLYNNLTFRENRFVSFYGNASYTYDYKYDVTASIRIDQSDLFGTDPKYQYRPLWSLGTSWHMAQEEFMKEADWINKLSLRLTYGIGGNVSKDAGPFLTLLAAQYNSWINDFGSEISNPPNPALRWEKTATTNVGVDFSLFNNIVSGSIDYYNRYSTDLLAYREADPSLGWDKLMLNYGTMYNRGIDISLNTQNLKSPDFQWTSGITFNYNKNKLIDVDDSDLTILRYTQGNASVKGYPDNAVFSFRYAGLNAEGVPLYYNAAGEKKEYISSINDVVYSGTRTPVYSAALTNNLSYKNLNLSFMFVYYGGHVMRGEAAKYLSTPPGTNINREILNMWKKPGDEINPDATPGFTGAEIGISQEGHQWPSADKHVVKADYIKLRDLSLSYNFNKQNINKLGMESLSLILQVQNLWKWAANDKGYDPEAMTTYMYGWGARSVPTPATWTIGASINF